MDNRNYTIRLGKQADAPTVTLAPLTTAHYFRIQSQIPSDDVITKPEVPEGYTHDKAIELIDDYKKEWENYEGRVNGWRLTLVVGAARMKALDTGEFEAESKALGKLAKRYFMESPDSHDDPFEMGNAIAQLSEDVNGKFDILAFYGWTLMIAGGVDATAVDEVVKRLRDQSEGRSGNVGDRGSDAGIGATGGQGEPEATASEHNANVRPARRGAKVGRKTGRRAGSERRGEGSHSGKVAR